MTTFQDLLPVLVVMSVGLFVILMGTCLVKADRIVGRKRTSWLYRLPDGWCPSEWRTAFSTSVAFGRVVRKLPSEARMEIAEHLLEEGEPFTKVLLEVVRRLAMGSSPDLRRRSVKLLESDSISALVRVSLAERVLVSSSNPELKIEVINALVVLFERGDAQRHLYLEDAIAAVVAARLGDASESVRATARRKFLEGNALHGLISVVDERLAQSLTQTHQEAQRDLLRFIYQYEARLPRSRAKARHYDLRM